MHPHIWYIHGAYASHRSFNWLRTNLPDHTGVEVEYSSKLAPSTVFDMLVEKAQKTDEPFDIVAHSLGGVMAAKLSHVVPNVRRIVTLAAPFGGSRMATFLQFIVPGNMMSEIQPYSTFMSDLRRKGVDVPTRSLVAVAGRSPALFEPNDGVVTHRSQTALRGPDYHEVDANHFEILLDQTTLSHVRTHLWD